MRNSLGVITSLGALFLTSALFYLAPWPLVFAPALLAVLLQAVRRPAFALVLVPLYSPLYMQPKQIGSQHFPPSELFLVCVALACLVPAGPIWPRVGSLWAQASHSPLAPPLVLFLCAGLLSTAFAADRHHALEWLRWTIVEPTIFVCLLLILVRRREHWYLLFGSVVAAGLMVGVIGLAQYSTHQGLGAVPGTSIVRVRSVYGSPDNVGLLYDRVLPLLLAFALFGRARPILRGGLCVAGALMVVVLFLTGSRGGELAVAVAFLLVLTLRFRWGRWLALAVLVLGTLLVVVKGPSLAGAFQFGHHNTVGRRLDLWRSSVRMIRDHPLLGVGPDNFLHYYAPRTQTYIPCDHGLGYMEPGASAEPCLSHPHNEVLDFYLSMGPLGLVAFFWALAIFWREALRRWNRTHDLASRSMLVGVMGAMLASILHGLVDNSYFLVDLSIIFWLLVAYVFFSPLAVEARVHIRGQQSNRVDAAGP